MTRDRGMLKNLFRILKWVLIYVPAGMGWPPQLTGHYLYSILMHKPQTINVPWFCRTCWHRGVMTAPKSFWKGKTIKAIRIDAQNNHMNMLRLQGLRCPKEDIKVIIKGDVL